MSTATSHPFAIDRDDRPTRPIVRSHDATRVLPLLGRICYAAIFILAAPKHFTPALVQVAAAHGVPFADLAVPLSGVFAAAGGLSVLFGYKAKTGALLLVLFLVPVTLFIHPPWVASQMENFMKNVGLLGGALLFGYFGAGPLSADAHIARTHVEMRQIDEDDAF
ncbi:MAG TPA: DoxX family protein [Polyangiaceae bacterium]|jgi:putative oxidoreductase